MKAIYKMLHPVSIRIQANTYLQIERAYLILTICQYFLKLITWTFATLERNTKLFTT